MVGEVSDPTWDDPEDDDPDPDVHRQLIRIILTALLVPIRQPVDRSQMDLLVEMDQGQNFIFLKASMIVDYLPSDDAIYIVGKDPTSDWLLSRINGSRPLVGF